MRSTAALLAVRDAFRAAGLDSASLDARLLTAAALTVSPAGLLTHPDRVLNALEADDLSGFAARRIAREPVARILGRAEFWSLPFRLSPGTLVPRPDTETVVEAALAEVADVARPLSVLDLGTGSGCILVALLSELRDAHGLGIDRSEDALRTAWSNALRNGVAARALFAASDWGGAVAGRYDLVVSNPPYIPTATLRQLDPEVVAHDPLAALDGGSDGLDEYRHLFTDLPRLMAPSGVAVVEIGYDQAEQAVALARRTGLSVTRTAHDLGGRSRAVVLRHRARPL